MCHKLPDETYSPELCRTLSSPKLARRWELRSGLTLASLSRLIHLSNHA
jgi:hypothetical protein